MIITFNDRDNAEGGGDYFATDFERGPAQEAGLSMPTWFQFSKPRLPLPEQPSLEAFTHLLNNRTPDGKQRLTLRDKSTRLEAGKEVANRRADYEFTFSCSKSITLLALCLGDSRIRNAYENVVWEGLTLAAEFASTRVRKHGADHDRTTGHVIGLLNHHVETRASDPQLHSHAIFFNVTWDPIEACFKALQFDSILHHKELIRHWVAARFYEELRRSGYDIEPANHGFRIGGVPVEAERIVSKRALALEEAIRTLKKRKGKVSPEDKKNLMLSIRPNKEEEDWATMHARWRGELADHWEVLKNVVAAAQRHPREAIPHLERRTAASRVLDATLDHLLEKYACVTPELLLTRALTKADGTWNGADAQPIIDLRIEEGSYVRETDRSLTTPIRQEQLRMSVLQAHATKRPLGAIPIRAPDAGINHSIQLAASPATIVVAVTNTSNDSKTAVRALHRGMRAFGRMPVFAMPASINASGRAKPLSQALAEAESIVVIGQAEKITHTELDAIIAFAAQPGRQVFLLASRKALENRQTPSIVAAFARHRWVPLTDLTSPDQKSPRKKGTSSSLVPRSLALIERKKSRAITKAAGIAARCLTNHEIVQVITDNPDLATSLGATIANQLGKINPGAAATVPIYTPRPPSPPRPGDIAISESATRHFAQGECVRVTASGAAIVVKKANGQNKTITPKVWNKLKPVTLSEMCIQPGTVLTLAAGVPGNKHRLGEGTTVQVKSISTSGTINLTNGEKLPAWFRFLQPGYLAANTTAKRKFPGKALIFLRKRPGRAMRKLIRSLAQTGSLLSLAVSRAAHLKSLSSLAVKLAMANIHRRFPQQETELPMPNTEQPELPPLPSIPPEPPVPSTELAEKSPAANSDHTSLPSKPRLPKLTTPDELDTPN